MTMLAASGFGLLAFSRIDESSPVWQNHDRTFWQSIGFHFDHPAWRSSFDIFKVSFWDLIQPAFMFMVGAAMPFSSRRRQSLGEGRFRRTVHALLRSVALVLLGVFLYSMGHERTNWIFPNVLCQIGLGYFFVWMIHHLRFSMQLAAIAIILVSYWGWFVITPPPNDYDYAAVGASKEKGEVFEGRFAPWSKNANAAFFFDGWLLPRLRSTPAVDELPKTASVPSVQWQTVSLRQESTESPKSEPENETPADAKTDSDKGDDEAKSSDQPANASPEADLKSPPAETTNPAPESPSKNAGPGEPNAGEAPASETDAGETPDTANSEPVPAAAIFNVPDWFRQWFLSNTEPYTFNGGGYTTLNFIPSMATTLLGVLCGQLLMNPDRSRWSKLGLLIFSAVVCLGLGIAADQTICPVVKRIWTPSWVLFSGGYVIGMLAVFYFLFDIVPLKWIAFPLVVVGMNSILIYMLGQTISGWMRDNVVKVHLTGMIDNVFGPRALDPQWYGPITLPTTVFALYWLFLLWLYRQRIFLRL
jgi:predicted acyltransferase